MEDELLSPMILLVKALKIEKLLLSRNPLMRGMALEQLFSFCTESSSCRILCFIPEMGYPLPVFPLQAL